VIKTILVALDASNLSESVMASLHELQLENVDKIVLSHVLIEQNPDLERAADRPHGYADNLAYRQIEQQLQAYQEKLPCPSDIEIVTGDPAEEIVRLANIYKANLIVIGNRGLTGLKRILQGSVSSQVLEEAPCSVWVVKPPVA
jgi:nucleotide-binding universal stress UspA family protein